MVLRLGITIYDKTFFYAIQTGNKKKVEKCLNQCINIDAEIAFNISPLSLAVAFEEPRIIQFLLEQKANPNVKNTSNETPLMIAAIHCYKKAIDLLLKQRANVNDCSTEGDWQKETPLLIVAAKGNLECVKLLVAAKADIHYRNKNDKTAYELAIEKKHLDIAEYLLQAAKKSNKKTCMVF